MYIPIGVKTDNSLLQSLIKIKDLIPFLKEHKITACGILDNRLYGVMEFYFNCKQNDIKPIIGLDVEFNKKHLYLYAKNYEGYKSLLKINSIIEERELTIIDLKEYNRSVLCILPFESYIFYDEIETIFKDVYLGYCSDFEKNNAKLITDKLVFLNILLSFTSEDTKYIDYLHRIDNPECPLGNYEKNYYLNVLENDSKTIEEVIKLLNVEIPTNKRYIPHFSIEIENSYNYLASLAKKGLAKRLNNNIPNKYSERLKYELEVIKNMGFDDYFLIVYDYVKFAKKNGIVVGPGRGSAAGSLVSYVLGITNIDPLKYDLLFERFLNPERITMPDIDIDFEFTRREEVIDYVRKKYGEKCVANILTFSNLSSRQVVKDVGKVLGVQTSLTDRLASFFVAKDDLKTNYLLPKVKEILRHSKELQKVYKVSLKLEGLKRQTSTHAAGVVISSIDLDEIIPISINEENIQTGIVMEYLETLGLLKMDFLALKNLTIIKEVLELIKENTGIEIDLNAISLDDQKTILLFNRVDTEGVFQFESKGMKNFLKKLKVQKFSDLVAAEALFRPGPMANIDNFIARKEGRQKITYPVKELENILKDTYGIMIYQEQIMQVLVVMGDYTFSEADNIRRAMSKKKKEVMIEEKEKFVTRAVKKGFNKEKALEVFDLVLKFADYGFNKAHSVSYALIGYQMGYLKSHYPIYFVANLLNMNIGSEIKTREYIKEARKNNIRIYKPDINKSVNKYLIKDNNLLLPLSVIKNVGSVAAEGIIKERLENGEYKDFFDFVARTYGKCINRRTLEYLIDASVFATFKENHATLKANIDSAINYAELRENLDESLIMKPAMEYKDEEEESILMSRELESYGFYVNNHPASKYSGNNIVKLENVVKYFDKFIKTIVIINSIYKIKTRTGEEMAFIDAADETGSITYVIFPKRKQLLLKLEKNKLYEIIGQVTRRMDKYQIVISNIISK